MSYKIQPLKLGGILDQAIAITKNHFGLLFSIMLLLLIPFSLITGLITMSLVPQLPALPTAEDYVRIQEAQAEHWPVFLLIGVANGLIVLPLTNAAVIQAVAHLYLGQPITASAAIKHAFARFFPLLGTTILMSLAIMGGFMLLIVPGILCALWFGLAQHVVVIEELSGSTALGRSKKLVRPHLGTFLVLGLIMLVITYSLGMVSGLIPQPHFRLVAQSLLAAVSTILWTAAGVVFYFSCRCAVENFDLHFLAQAIGASPERVEEPTIANQPVS
jgi:hypothetical protein